MTFNKMLSSRCVVGIVLDGDIVESKFKFLSGYYVPFWIDSFGKCKKSFTRMLEIK